MYNVNCRKGGPIMVCVVYIDVLFVLNLIVNYLILFATARLSSAPIKRWRIALGAALGALYAVIAFFQGFEILTAIWVKILVAGLMILISFGFRAWQKVLRYFFVFCGLSFAFGGCVFAIYLITNGANGLMDVRNGVFYLKVPLGILLVASAISYLIFSLVFRRSATGTTKHEILQVELHCGGRGTVFYALVDSGNTLVDPLTNRSVMIVEYNTVRDVLPGYVRDILDGIHGEQFVLKLPELPKDMHFKLIPYKTVDAEFHMLLAFKPEQLIVDGKEKKGMLVALCPNQISDGGAYSALTGIEA